MSALDTTDRTELDALVSAATAGDEAAYGRLFRRYRNGLVAHCYGLLRSYEEAEDLTQETFLRAWRHRGSFRGESSFSAWLYRIATNACLTAIARRPPRAFGGLDVDSIPTPVDRVLADLRAGPEAELVSRETIYAAVRQLPPNQRAALFLRDVLGWSARDTAELLETSVASVTSALQRGREALRANRFGHQG
jgi:RNA polymerase sigma-70 factor (ECF subfamily)